MDEPGFQKRLEEGVLSANKLVRCTVGVVYSNPLDAVRVLSTRNPVTAEEILAEEKNEKSKSKEIRVGSYSVYHAGKRWFCVPESTRVLVADNLETLSKILRRNDKPTFSDALERAFKKTDFGKPYVVVVDLQDTACRKNFGYQMRNVMPTELAHMYENIVAMTVHAKAGTAIDFQFDVLCNDRDSAYTLERLMTTCCAQRAMPDVDVKAIGPRVNFHGTLRGKAIHAIVKYCVNDMDWFHQ